MRKTTFFILCALIISLAAPMQAVTTAGSQGDTAVILTLDVCGSPGSSLSGSYDEMPSIHECPCMTAPLALAGFYRTACPGHAPAPTPFQEERPPEV